MTLTTPPTAPVTTDPTTFASRADALVAWLATFVGEMNTLAAAMDAAAAGGVLSIPYTFSTTTTDSDPGAGFLRLNNATQNTATVVRIDLFSNAGADMTNALDLFNDSTSTIMGFIKLTKLLDSTKYLIFSVTAVASPSGYRNITGTCVASSAASPFSNGDSITLEFTRTGDKGDTGATGPAGTSPDLTAPGPIGGATPGAGTFTTATANAFVPNSGSVPTNGMYLSAANTLAWATNSAVRMTLNATGVLSVTSIGSRHIFAGTVTDQEAAVFTQSASSNPYGIAISFTGAAPNDTTRYFLQAADNSATRCVIRSNGGIANFTANDVNLSDINTKPEFVLLEGDELDKLEAAFVAVDWAKFKYADQSHDDWNYGYSAQGVEAAFAVANPTITDVWNPVESKQTGVRQEKVGEQDGVDVFEDVPVFEYVDTPPERQLRSVYHQDLNNIGNALLARALTRITELEKRVAALEAA